jgi:hypothetical protein
MTQVDGPMMAEVPKVMAKEDKKRGDERETNEEGTQGGIAKKMTQEGFNKTPCRN